MSPVRRLIRPHRPSAAHGRSPDGDGDDGREVYGGLVTEQSLGYIKANAEAWEARREDQLVLARRQWSATEPTWGMFGVPEAQVGLLPADLDGARTVELGCGTGYV